MKYTLLLSLLLTAFVSKSQTFWTENFNNGCTSLCLSYTGPNGMWTFTSTGTNATGANAWYVSCAENGEPAGTCGATCAGSATLHIGATAPSILADLGAAYNAAKETNMRAESPTISCAGKTNINLAFNYIEDGEGTLDNATVWYYDGSIWAQISDPAKTATTCGNGQGLWTAYTIALPASANNNPNVKIGFNWTNNTSGGTDPSFAVDSIAISGTAGGNAPVAAFTVGPNDTVCLGQCLTFTDASTNTPTSWAWTFPGATPASSAIQNPAFICYTAAGTYTVTLTATNGAGSDTETHKIVIRSLPHPHLTAAGHTFTCGGGPFSPYQWHNGAAPVGTNSATYTATSNGIYYVTVTDANGCTGNSDSITVTDLAVQNVNSSELNLNLYPNPNSGTFTLKGTIGLYENTAWIEVTDVTGRVVMKDNVQVQGGIIDKQIILDKGLAKGMYMLKLGTGSNRYTVAFRKD